MHVPVPGREADQLQLPSDLSQHVQGGTHKQGVPGAVVYRVFYMLGLQSGYDVWQAALVNVAGRYKLVSKHATKQEVKDRTLHELLQRLIVIMTFFCRTGPCWRETFTGPWRPMW